MKFLDPDFRQAVFADVDSETGEVIVSGLPFSPVDILANDPDSYSEAFQNWLSDEWASKRQECLNVILKDPSNYQRYQDLVQSVQSGRVVPFVGSGMSEPSGKPMWSEFLRQVRTSSTLTKRELEALLKRGDFERAASALLEKMPPQLFDERLDQAFLTRNTDKVAGAVRCLPEIFDGTIITTNFDNLLEIVQEGSEVGGFQEVLHGGTISDFRVMRGRGQRCLLKIHGDHKRPAERVLTEAEYDSTYASGSAARTELEYLFGCEPILFLGCSLSNDRTMELLKEVVENDLNTPRNYAFLKRPKNSRAQVNREHFLSERKIFPIWYDGDHDEENESLLFGLMRELNKI